MKKALLLLMVVITQWQVKAQSMPEIRDLYGKAAVEEEAYNKLLASLEKGQDMLPELKEGYSAACKVVSANHIFNPYSKWVNFKEGKNLLDQTIEQFPSSVELRFIRYSIQDNAPSFLGYSDHLIMDKKFILKQLSSITDDDLKLRIVDYFLWSGTTTSEEKNHVYQFKN